MKHWVKVRKFQNEYMKSSLCPKYEWKIWKILPWHYGAEFFYFFVHILGNATTSYIHSEIFWPLVMVLHQQHFFVQLLIQEHSVVYLHFTLVNKVLTYYYFMKPCSWYMRVSTLDYLISVQSEIMVHRAKHSTTKLTLTLNWLMMKNRHGVDYRVNCYFFPAREKIF